MCFICCTSTKNEAAIFFNFSKIVNNEFVIVITKCVLINARPKKYQNKVKRGHLGGGNTSTIAASSQKSSNTTPIPFFQPTKSSEAIRSPSTRQKRVVTPHSRVGAHMSCSGPDVDGF